VSVNEFKYVNWSLEIASVNVVNKIIYTLKLSLSCTSSNAGDKETQASLKDTETNTTTVTNRDKIEQQP
jgi:hypothetical protein